MSLQSITNISVDFCDKKYILINAKQYDSSSRWISVTCYDNGKPFSLSANKHAAYIRYKKADGNSVLNFCRINYRGEVLVELTEQMLSAEGICYVDLIIVNKGDAMVNIDTGEIIVVDDGSILSTMAFCVNVYEAAVDNSEFASSYEYDALNSLLQRAEADYAEVVTVAKSYARGDTGVRYGEDTDNAKYYYEQSLINASDANKSAGIVQESAEIASSSATIAQNSAESANSSSESASNSANAAANSASAAKISEDNAKASKDSILESSNLSKSYAVGSTGTRDGEDTDNAKYYYSIVKNIVDGIGGAFVPMGTITFAELKTIEKSAGFIYNISDNFVTDETFAEGAGKSYTAGTNVYFTGGGYWDCFGGSAPETASADEVKTYLGL